MLWKSSPIPMYQFMWYASGMGKGAVIPYIGTICFLSAPKKGWMRRINLWQELKIALQLQHHQWTESLLLQDHLRWSYQVQQVAHPRVVWISLLYLDAMCGKPGHDFHGGTRISVYRQIPVHPISGMHGLVCVSASMSYPVCTLFSGRVQCE